jgi:cellobiose-specific phosphotransferase system component IIB
MKMKVEKKQISLRRQPDNYLRSDIMITHAYFVNPQIGYLEQIYRMIKNKVKITIIDQVRHKDFDL